MKKRFGGNVLELIGLERVTRTLSSFTPMLNIEAAGTMYMDCLIARVSGHKKVME